MRFSLAVLVAVIVILLAGFFLFQQVKRADRWSSFGLIASLVASLVAGLIGVFLPSLSPSLGDPLHREEGGRPISIRRAEIDSIRNEIRALQDSLSVSASRVSGSELIGRQSLAIAALDSRVGKLEQLFVTDAERSVTLPLLRRDLVSVENRLDRMQDEFKVEDARLVELQTQNRWVIGTLGLGILGLLVPIAKLTFGKKSD